MSTKKVSHIRQRSVRTDREVRKLERSTKRNTSNPPAIVGKLRNINVNHHQKYCPVCWHLSHDSVSRTWAQPEEIVRCGKCRHHSVRSMMQSTHHVVIESLPYLSCYTELINATKSFFSNKLVEKPKVLFVFPPDGMIESFSRAYSTSRTTPRERRMGIVNPALFPEIYCVANANVYDSYLQRKLSHERCSLVNLKYGWKSIINRPGVIASGIADAQQKFGRFDLIVTTHLLSSMLDPSPIVREVISSCEYFICLENEYTSGKIKNYTQSLTFQEEENYFKNGEKLVYPIAEDDNIKFSSREQYQYFSRSSLCALFKNESAQVEKELLPKGKSRSFKVSRSTSRIGDDKIFIHNIPNSYLLSR